MNMNLYSLCGIEIEEMIKKKTFSFIRKSISNVIFINLQNGERWIKIKVGEEGFDKVVSYI